MARLITCGAEFNDLGTTNLEGVGSQVNVGTITHVTTPVHGGSRAWKADSTVSNGVQATILATVQCSHAVNYYQRGYFHVPTGSLPSSSTKIMAMGTGAYYIALNTNGTLQLASTAGAIGSPSAAITLDSYFRLELRVKTSASASSTEVEALLDGAQFAVSTTVNVTTLATNQYWGWLAAPGASKVIYIDDIAMNDDTGAAQNSWCGAGNIMVLTPISNNSIGNWKSGSAANATNDGYQWNALNNCPPAGSSTPNGTTFAIANAVSGAANAGRGDLNLAPYTLYTGGGVVPLWHKEMTFNTITIGNTSANTRRAMPFVWPSGANANAIWIMLGKVGTPADNFQIAIQADSSGSPSGTDLVSASLAGGSVTAGSWPWPVSFSISTTALTQGTTYWLVYRRSGAVDAANYYITDGATAGASSGGSKTYNGTTWGSGVSTSYCCGISGDRSGDTITLVQQVICHGEDVATGVKTGTYGMVSNPAITEVNVTGPTTSNFGPDGSGAVGTYPSNWIVQRGAVSYAPSVTLSTSAVARINKTDTGTRSADLCFMGLVVEYVPGAAAANTPYLPWVPQLGPILAR